MTNATQKLLHAAVTALKEDGYATLLLLFDKREHACNCSGGIFPSSHCQVHGTNKVTALEVLCSETNDPQLLAAMAKDALLEIANPIQEKVN